MIELSNGNIALSSNTEPYPIVIIDSLSYQVKKEIQLEKGITSRSSLILFKNTFISCGYGNFVQISCYDFSVLFKSEENNFDGYGGMVPIVGGKYFAIQNKECITIIKA